MSLLITSVPQIYSNPDLSGKSGGKRNNLMLRNWLSMSYTIHSSFCSDSAYLSNHLANSNLYSPTTTLCVVSHLISRILSIQPLSLLKTSCRERVQQLWYKRSLRCYPSALSILSTLFILSFLSLSIRSVLYWMTYL